VNEMELWAVYKKTGDSQALGQLVKMHIPQVEAVIRQKYSRANIPYSAIRAKGLSLVVDAINSYDPKYNRVLSSHTYDYLKKLHRFVDQQKQVARISEAQSGKVAPYLEATRYMTENLGREPSSRELSDELGWGIRDVNKLKREITFETPTESWGGFAGITHETYEDDTIDYVYKFDLTPEEQFIFEHSIGFQGAPVYKASDIAKRLSILPSQVSQRKRTIAEKIGRRQSEQSLRRFIK